MKKVLMAFVMPLLVSFAFIMQAKAFTLVEVIAVVANTGEPEFKLKQSDDGKTAKYYWRVTANTREGIPDGTMGELYFKYTDASGKPQEAKADLGSCQAETETGIGYVSCISGR